MSFKIALPANIDATKLSYGNVRDLGASGAKTVSIRYGADQLTIQTPIMSIPYDVNLYEEKKKDKNNEEVLTHKYDINVSFKGMEENKQLQMLHDKLLAIENQILSDAWKNVGSWFKGREDEFDGPKSMRIVFNPVVKKGLDKQTKEVKYPSTMKIKIPFDTEKGEFKFASYNAAQEKVDFHSIKEKLKGGKGRLLIQLTGLWFVGKNFGCLWKLVQGQFWPVEANVPAAFSFLDDGEEARDDAASEKHDSDLEEAALSKNQIADSDAEDDEVEAGEDADAADDEEVEVEAGEDADAADEEETGEDPEEEDEPEPEPIPEPVKKVAAKKTAAAPAAAVKKTATTKK